MKGVCVGVGVGDWKGTPQDTFLTAPFPLSMTYRTPVLSLKTQPRGEEKEAAQRGMFPLPTPPVTPGVPISVDTAEGLLPPLEPTYLTVCAPVSTT